MRNRSFLQRVLIGLLLLTAAVIGNLMLSSVAMAQGPAPFLVVNIQNKEGKKKSPCPDGVMQAVWNDSAERAGDWPSHRPPRRERYDGADGACPFG